MDLQANRRANLIQLMSDDYCWPTFSDRPSPKYEDYDDSYAEIAGEYLGIEWEGPKHSTVEKQGKPESDVPKYAASIYDETYTMIGLFDSLTEALGYSNGQDGEYLTGGGSVVDLDHEPGVSGVVEKRTVVLTVDAFNAAGELLQQARLDGWMLPPNIQGELIAAFPTVKENQ